MLNRLCVRGRGDETGFAFGSPLWESLTQSCAEARPNRRNNTQPYSFSLHLVGLGDILTDDSFLCSIQTV